MTPPLPICAVIPIYECAERLRRHLQEATPWLDAVAQIVVVDSDSRDGSAQVAREFLDHRRAEILSVPPGLYAAWNAGVAKARTEFVYISTVGDTITLDGLAALHAQASALDLDVIISPPRCVHEDGTAAHERRFPIHQLVEASGIRSPLKLPAWLAYTLTTGFSVESLLGSSASNLYRASVLKRHPFPTDFGKAGDTAWLRRNALRVSVGIMPVTCASFLLHQDHGARPHGELADAVERVNAESEQGLAEYLSTARDADGGNLRILNAWRTLANISPEQTLDAIRHLEDIAKTNEQQREYIAELQAEIRKMQSAMEALTAECDRRDSELARHRSMGAGALFRQGVTRLFRR